MNKLYEIGRLFNHCVICYENNQALLLYNGVDYLLTKFTLPNCDPDIDKSIPLSEFNITNEHLEHLLLESKCSLYVDIIE